MARLTDETENGQRVVHVENEDGERPAAVLGEGATCPHCGLSPALRRFPAPRRAR